MIKRDLNDKQAITMFFVAASLIGGNHDADLVDYCAELADDVLAIEGEKKE